METEVEIWGNRYGPETRTFSATCTEYGDVEELSKLSFFPDLQAVYLPFTSFDDRGMQFVSRATELTYLNIQDTKVTDAGMAHIVSLKKLQSLRLKDNYQLTDLCAPYIGALPDLDLLSIHETSLTEKALKFFSRLHRLRTLVIYIEDDNFSFQSLMEFSEQLPDCDIIPKGIGVFNSGVFRSLDGVEYRRKEELPPDW